MMSEKWKDKRIEINKVTWGVFDREYIDFSQEGSSYTNFVTLTKKEFENIIEKYKKWKEDEKSVRIQ